MIRRIIQVTVLIVFLYGGSLAWFLSDKCGAAKPYAVNLESRSPAEISAIIRKVAVSRSVSDLQKTLLTIKSTLEHEQ
jgi:hypothetical protein